MRQNLDTTTSVTAQDRTLSEAHIAALTGSTNAVMDFRVIHDRDKGAQAYNRRGTLANCWPWLCAMNDQGFGCFFVVAELDGAGCKMPNVRALRAVYTDHDSPDAAQRLEVARKWTPAPSFFVESSPGRFHIYWKVEPFTDTARFTTVQRKLSALFNSDPKVSDATRVLRLSGTVHRKTDTPHLVRCWSLNGYHTPTTLEVLEAALAPVVVIEGGNGERKPLGDPSLAAPSLEAHQRALDLQDPNDLDRDAWVSFTSAWKQAGWSLAPEADLWARWRAWTERYDGNDEAEGRKLWASINTTEVGWRSLLHKVPALRAEMDFGGVPMPSVTAPTVQPAFGELLTPAECAVWFEGCRLIGPENVIVDRKGIAYGPSAFNAAYGGKRFVIAGDGSKVTDEPWKAATRSTVWTVPKVDGTTFRTDQPTSAVTTDDLGRTAVNVYVPAIIEREAGDPTPFLDHLKRMFPDDGDRRILIEYFAHNVRFPGHKIPWAPVIQSTEGMGKNALKHVMTHAMGVNYVYFPKAKQLGTSGSKFNDWMSRKLLFIADEIRTDDRRELLDALKDMVSEDRLEMEGKGTNQKMADNIANWIFFTNHLDAIPIGTNDRRYAIFFSPIQTKDDLIARGMDDAYFAALYDGFLGQRSHRRGLRIVANYLLEYPIERGAIPMRAPVTTSTAAAIEAGRGWLAVLIANSVEAGANGFRGGWINTAAVGRVLREAGKEASGVAVGKAIQELGYRRVRPDQASRGWMQDDPRSPTLRGRLYNRDHAANPDNYGRDQGYE